MSGRRGDEYNEQPQAEEASDKIEAASSTRVEGVLIDSPYDPMSSWYLFVPLTQAAASRVAFSAASASQKSA